ncbi:MAG: hypothetical protein O3A87_04050 [Verrucomicrobia bacterium]|nr:hypothetical protein [Verrucomicrobiota bacterium]MDA1005637.1 hypothetical protein [Verrucomicrobiota bacterium]
MVVPVQSLIRKEDPQWWFEMVVADAQLDLLKQNLPSSLFKNSSAFLEITDDDAAEWREAFDRNKGSLQNHSLLKFAPVSCTEKIAQEQAFEAVAKEAIELLAKRVLPYPIPEIARDKYWDYIPDITLGGKGVRWHPLLSHYLLAFVTITLLRYQPHLLPASKPESFIVECWCEQGPVTALRYFLMALTPNHVRVTAY